MDTPLETRSALSKIAVLIPAWQPGAPLLELVRALCMKGFAAVIIVDDGSGPRFHSIFDSLSELPCVHLLRHAVNLGKGRALKSGFNHFLNLLTGCEGLVTADADGQHAPADIVRVAEALHEANDRFVLGARSFSREVPWRSRFGNQLTRRIFRFVTGRSLLDTQTGLRAIPTALVAGLLPLDGERYEYEMTALAHLCRLGAPIEVPIQTIYLDGNRASHFDPVRDSMRIYFVLLRFYLSSLIAAGIDFVGFSAAFWATQNILASVALGRLSSLVNFALNKRYVFNSEAPVKAAIWRYYLLVAAIGTLSYGCTLLLANRLRWNVFLAKLLVDTTLSLVSFSVQRTFVFREQEAPRRDRVY